MQLVIISGPPHAGKSAAADALCQRYDRMLHIDVDALRGFLRMGRRRPWDESQEAQDQADLFIASATDMARRFLIAGYGVVIDDVIGKDDLTKYRDALGDCPEPLHFVVLLPALDVLLAQELRWPDHLRELHDRFAAWKEVAVIDPADLAPELVADRVMSLAAGGRALLTED